MGNYLYTRSLHLDHTNNTNMSHLTKTKTGFKNRLYLEKSLDKLEIPNFKSNSINNSDDLILSKINNTSFNWNGQFFELNVDHDYWNQPYSLSHFLSRIKTEYATESLIAESNQYGFIPTQFENNCKGYRTITLQRWNGDW